MLVLITSLIIALIISKILNRKFLSIWLFVFVTILTIAFSTLTIMTIVECGIINKSMLFLIGSVMCWISAVTMWRSEI